MRGAGFLLLPELSTASTTSPRNWSCLWYSPRLKADQFYCSFERIPSSLPEPLRRTNCIDPVFEAARHLEMAFEFDRHLGEKRKEWHARPKPIRDPIPPRRASPRAVYSGSVP